VYELFWFHMDCVKDIFYWQIMSSKYVIRLYKVKMVLWFHVTSKCDSVRKSDYDLVWLCV